MSELKSLLAHFVMTYEMKMEHEGIIPSPLSFGTNIIPDQKARVLFRKRQA